MTSRSTLARLGIDAFALNPSWPWQCSQRRAISNPRNGSPFDATSRVSSVQATLEGIRSGGSGKGGAAATSSTTVAPSVNIKIEIALLRGTTHPFVRAQFVELLRRYHHQLSFHRVMPCPAIMMTRHAVRTRAGKSHVGMAHTARPNHQAHVVVVHGQHVRGVGAGDAQMNRNIHRHQNAARYEHVLLCDH